MSPFLAPNGHGPMSDLSPLSGEERKSNFGAARSVDDPSATFICPNVRSRMRGTFQAVRVPRDRGLDEGDTWPPSPAVDQARGITPRPAGSSRRSPASAATELGHGA